ncbi:MAG TPA: twin-arginine translocase TatA/TatE family subunit [Pseudobdellovibrionaceae bacterium]|nr:twin-arginine translocase TatA/TatE family subunit [Pseudobdellovibrionaceae bacterium]
MFGLSLSHWVLILVLTLIFFGKDKVPKLSRSLGEAIRNYKNAVNEIDVKESQISDDPNLVAKQKQNQNASYRKDS